MDSLDAPLITLGSSPQRIREPEAVIAAVEPGSIADQLGLEPGDRLCRINGQPPRDVIDYELWCSTEELELQVADRDGEVVTFEFTKDAHEDLGLTFESELFIPLRTCNNGCLFCFVHQAPPGLRPTVYVKDDDYRLSFLHGHFTTLTNLTEPHYERILDQRLSPLYVSVHASNPALRRQLLDNAKADLGWSYLQRLCAAGIVCHTQVVCCPGVNDGAALNQTLTDIAALGPAIASIGVVPVGLTRFQEHPLMRPMTVAEAADTIDRIAAHRETLGPVDQGFVYAADELFLNAGREFPGADYYDDFAQLENGIGEARLFVDEAAAVTGDLGRRAARPQRAYLVTGEYGGLVLPPLVAQLGAVSGLELELVVVPNRLFGGNVKCAGLLAGRDVVDALAALPPADLAIVPARALNEHELFLDDVRLADLARRIGYRIEPALGFSELTSLLGWPRQDGLALEPFGGS